jgi:hypothetical protein
MSQLGCNPYLLNLIPLFNVADPSNTSASSVSGAASSIETTLDTTTHTLNIDTIQAFTSSQPIQIKGDLEVNGQLTVTDDVQMDANLTVTQDITCQTLYQLSDARRKKDIIPLTGSEALNTVCQLQGVHYTLDGKPSVGFLAQEVEKVLPQAVLVTNGTYAIDYSKIIPLLVEAVKEIAKRLPE